MSDYLITCTIKTRRNAAGHEHIVSVGIGTKRYKVADIYQLIDAGHTFRTSSPSSGTEAVVAKYHCCGIDTLRSHSDGYWDNNLDRLTMCA